MEENSEVEKTGRNDATYRIIRKYFKEYKPKNRMIRSVGANDAEATG